MRRYDHLPYEMYPDNCERCAGTSLGVRGNENRIDGRVVCDYCSCEMDGTPEKREKACLDCKRPLSTHVLMKHEHIERCWAEGISLEICRSGFDYNSATNEWSLVSLGEQGPDDPCDEDFMKEISS